MTKRSVLHVFWSAILVTGGLYWGAINCAAVAHADSCSYRLSAPHLSTLKGGTVQVTASLEVSSCEGKVSPANSTVCVSSELSNGRCAAGVARNAATVYADPAGADSWTSTGVGCYITGPLGQQVCISYGPVHSTG